MFGTRVSSPSPSARILWSLAVGAFILLSPACEDPGGNGDTLGFLVGPLGVSDVQVATVEGQSVSVLIETTGTPENTLSFAIVSEPQHGAVSAFSPVDAQRTEIDYTPNDGFVGQDTFTFNVLDGGQVVETGSAVVTVYPEVRFEAEIVSNSPTLRIEARAFSPSGYDLPAGTYRWSFDGAIESGPVDTHAMRQREFSISGTHVVTLTVVLAVLGPIECSYGPDGLQKEFTFERTSGENRTGEGHISVSPLTNYVCSGVTGGPFAPAARTYQLTNIGGESLLWSAVPGDNWLTIAPVAGSLESGETVDVIATINTAANGLPVGTYSDTIAFTNNSNGQGDADAVVELFVIAPIEGLNVTPSSGLHGAGPAGGPFVPDSQTFILSNLGANTLQWSASTAQPWLSLSAMGGILESGKSATVVASFNANANALPTSDYSGTIFFENVTDGVGNTLRPVTLSINPASASLRVDPWTGFNSSGDVGGPFTPSQATFTLSNPGGQPLDWQATRTQSWVTLSSEGGTLDPGASTDVVVSINAVAAGLGGGVFNDIVNFDNLTNGNGDTSRGVLLNISAAPGTLDVSPSSGFTSSGTEGGPFDPDNKVYTLTNNGDESMTWSAASVENWLTLSSTSGLLGPGESTNVTVSLNANANALAIGSYSDSIEFFNETNGDGDAVRGVLLTVNAVPGEMSVTPLTGINSNGVEGGPFNPIGKNFTIDNTGGEPIDWSVSVDQNWVTLSATSGTLNGGGSVAVSALFNANVNSLPPGTYDATISFTNDTNGDGDDTRGVLLTVEASPGVLSVSPLGGLTSSGAPGGPFSPNSKTYTLENTGGEAIGWSAAGTKAWVQTSPSSGTLNPGASVNVTVQIDSDANGLSTGTYSDTVSITNDTNGTGDAVRLVLLTVTAEPGALGVSPAGDLASSGPAGGPFSPASKTYTLENIGGQSISWSAASSESWVSLAPTSGTLSAGDTMNVTVSINSDADGLSPGLFTDTVQFTNQTNGDGDTDRDVQLTVQASPGALSVSSSAGLTSTGAQGGPFTPASKIYTLTNTGGQSIAWSVARTQNWVSLSAASGTLNAGQSANVTVSINANANGLGSGTHNDTVTFTNATNGDGDTTRSVELTVTAVGGGDALPMTTASRTTGIAPLSVFFDAVNDSGEPWNSGVAQPSDGDYASYYYEWDFDDGTAGRWSYGRNEMSGNYPERRYATGYIASHVFNAAGTYDVRLRVTDSSGNTQDYEQQITVLAEPAGGWTTYYVSSSSGNDGNNGTSPATPFQSLSKGLSKVGANVRILFKRGDTWSTGNAYAIGNATTCMLGAYYNADGSDDPSRPKPQITETTQTRLLWAASPDIRIQNLRLVGPGNTSTNPAIKVSETSTLIQNVDIESFQSGMFIDGLNSHIENCHTQNIGAAATGWHYYVGGEKIAIMGNYGHTMVNGGHHILRRWNGSKTLISQNTFADAGDGGHVIKFHQVTHTGHGNSIHNLLSDNVLSGAVWTLAIGPQNNVSDERVGHTVVERNMISASAVPVMVWARYITVRNNVLMADSEVGAFKGVNVAVRGIEPAPVDVRILNNTIYTGHVGGGGSTGFAGVSVNAGTGGIVRNNVVSAPNWAGATPVAVDGTVPLTADHNLYSNAPGFSDPGNEDFMLQQSSPCVGAGTNAVAPWVRSDFDLQVRNSAGAYDIGALAD